MKDAEILATVHRWMNQSIQRDEDNAFKAQRMIDCKNFIEQEWQMQDEETDKYSTIGLENMADTTYSQAWYSKNRGLEIDEDGTVTNLK